MVQTPKVESYEQAIGELDQIVNQLEGGELPLDKALDAFKRGIELSQYCQKTLTQAEEMVATMITQAGEAPFDEEQA